MSIIRTHNTTLEGGNEEYWGKGIGTLFIKMLVDFALDSEQVDVLHCFCEDYNIRSSRVWEKNGFELVFSEELQQPQIGKSGCIGD